MMLSFSSPVPLREECHIKYYFPTIYYDADDITEIKIGDLFSDRPVTFYPSGSNEDDEFTVTVEDADYKSIEFYSCDSFRRQKVETTYIYGLKQPISTKPTASLKAEIRDSQDQIVAYFDSDVSFTPTAGSMELISASLSPSTVYAESELTWSI